MADFKSPHNEPVLIGVIGGSGVYGFKFLENSKHYAINTPFGLPSGDVCVAQVGGVPCAFLPRHGPAHTFNPSEVNYRANVYAMKLLGVKYLLAINAVGSLDDKYQPGDIVLVDQIIDKTFARQTTFFEKGIVVHVDFAQPMSSAFRAVARAAIESTFPELLSVGGGGAGFTLHDGATILTMEGPQFSTRAESLWHKSIGAHLVGMTTATEAKLAREAEMAYLTVAMVTDMDAWCSGRPHVDAAAVMKVAKANVEKAEKYPQAIIAALAANPFVDPAHSALKLGLMRKTVGSEDIRRRLGLLLAKYPDFLEKP